MLKSTSTRGNIGRAAIRAFSSFDPLSLSSIARENRGREIVNRASSSSSIARGNTDLPRHENAASVSARSTIPSSGKANEALGEEIFRKKRVNARAKATAAKAARAIEYPVAQIKSLRSTTWRKSSATSLSSHQSFCVRSRDRRRGIHACVKQRSSTKFCGGQQKSSSLGGGSGKIVGIKLKMQNS